MPHRIVSRPLVAAVAALAVLVIPSASAAAAEALDGGNAAVAPASIEAPPAAVEAAGAPAPAPAAALAPAAAAAPEAAPRAAPTAPQPAPAGSAEPAATPPGGPAQALRAIQVPSARGSQRVDWYRPAKLEDADAKLPWNRSIFGAFDPWTKQKVTLLFQHHSLTLPLPAEEGLNEFGDEEAGEELKSIAYPSGRFSASLPGVRLEIGNWSLAVATASGTLRWDASDETGPAFDMRATAYEAIISRGFGAWAIVDGGARDFRLGISWPELYVRLAYGKFNPELLERRDFHFGIAGAGVSLLGIRMTLGDAVFAEVRAGDLSVHQAVSFLELGEDDEGEVEQDILLQRRAGFELRPMLRIGFAL